jgi:alpha-mannosidase
MFHDVPCTSFSAPLNKNEKEASLMLTSDTKYGFRNSKNSVALTLIRATSDPDPYPEYDIHNIRIGVAAVTDTSAGALLRLSSEFSHPVFYTSTRSHFGTLPLSASFITVKGKNTVVSTVKTPECGEDGIIVRVYNAGYEPETARLEFYRRPKSVYLTDISEGKGTPLVMSGNGVEFPLKALEIATLRVVL